MNKFINELEELVKQYQSKVLWHMSEYPELYAEIKDGDKTYHLSVQEVANE